MGTKNAAVADSVALSFILVLTIKHRHHSEHGTNMPSEVSLVATLKGIIQPMVINSIPEIGSVLRNAIMFNFKNPPEAIMTADSLLAQVQQLFNLLDQRKTDYVLVGGI